MGCGGLAACLGDGFLRGAFSRGTGFKGRSASAATWSPKW